MKSKSTLHQFLAIAASSLLAICSASATTYTWTQIASGDQDWTTAGNWDGNGQFVSGITNELRFFADNTTIIPTTTLQTVISVPTALSMNTLTLSGRGPNALNVFFPITIGTNASTWTLGDGTTSTVNLDSSTGNGSLGNRDMRYTVAANLQLTGGTGGITTFTGDSLSSTGAIFSGNITETTAGQGITKSGTSVLILSGALSYTGATTVDAGTLRITSASTTTSEYIINGGILGDSTIAANAMTTATLANKNITVNGVGTLGVNAVTTSGALTLNADLSLFTQGTANFDGAVTGTGKLSVGYVAQSNTILNLNSSGNTFTGGVDYSKAGNGQVTLSVKSFVDTATPGTGNIRFGIASNGGTHTFDLGSGYNAGGLTFDNRQFEIAGVTTGKLSNSSAEQFTVNTDLLVTATGTRTLQLAGNGAGLSTFAGDITNGALDALILNKIDGGTWILSGANTYTGKTTISGGTLSINSIQNAASTTANALGTPGVGANSIIDIANNARLRYTGTGHGSDRVINNTTTNGGTITLDASGASGTFALTGGVTTASTSGTSTVTLTGTGLGSQSGVISNGTGTNVAAISKSGTGTWTLSGTNTNTGNTTLSAGKLVLDYSTNDTNKIAGVLTLSGGTLELSGSAGNYTEAVTSTTLNTGSTFITQPTGGATLDMGAITFTSGAIDFAENSIATTTTAVTNGILSQRATVAGTNFAMKSGSNIVAYDYVTSGVTGYTGAAMVANTNYELTANGASTLAGTTGATSNTLKIANTATGSLDVNTRTLTLGAILFAGSADYDIITSTGRVTPTVLHNYGTGGAVLNLGALGGALTQFGTGTTVLTSAALANAGVNVNGGTVQFSTNAQIGIVTNGAAITLNNGTLLASETVTLDNAGANKRNITLNAGGGTLAAANTKTLTVSGVISGVGNPLAIGRLGSTGTVELTGTNTYTGATTVSAGKLVVNGSISTSSLTTVASGATIGGSGTVSALTISSGGFVAPGNSPGILTVNGNYIQEGTYTAEIDGLTAGTQHDQISVNGTVNIAGGSLVTLFSGSYALNNLIFILLNDGTDAITGTYNGLAQGATVTEYGGFNWNISYVANSGTGLFTGGNDIALQAVVIPEPRAALLGGIGILLLLRRRR